MACHGLPWPFTTFLLAGVAGSLALATASSTPPGGGGSDGSSGGGGRDGSSDDSDGSGSGSGGGGGGGGPTAGGKVRGGGRGLTMCADTTGVGSMGDDERMGDDEGASADESTQLPATYQSAEELPQLPAATRGADAPNTEQGEAAAAAAPQSLEVGGEAAALDALGPVIVTEDGKLRYIANWDEMSETEREVAQRRIAKRNAERLRRLRDADGST